MKPSSSTKATPTKPSTSGMPPMSASPINQRVQAVMDGLVASGRELGLQAAAYHHGALVVDAWAGVADAKTARPVDGDTLFPVFSVTKGIAATIANILAERGVIDLDAPIARYWPAFAARGKQHVTLRQVLGHRAGVPHMPDGLVGSQICDWEAMCARIAEAEPLWEPGSTIYYHAMTYGWIVGEVARLADGRDFATLLRDEICAPLGIDSLFVGIPERVATRVAVLEAARPAPPSAAAAPATATAAVPAPPDPVAERSIPPYVRPLEDWMNRADIQRACIPASNGIMSARGIAKHYAALIGTLGVRILSPEALDRAIALNAPPGLGAAQVTSRFGLGYGLSGPESEPGRSFGHGGYGGATGSADRGCGLAIAVTKNRMSDSQQPGSVELITREIRAALGV